RDAVSRRDQAMLDGRIELLNHRQRDHLRQVDRCGWPRQRKACLRHVDGKPSLAWLAALEAAHCRLFERRKPAQEVLLLQSRTFPIREMDEPGSPITELILAMIPEQDK